MYRARVYSRSYKGRRTTRRYSKKKGLTKTQYKATKKVAKRAVLGQVETKRNTVIGEIFSPARTVPEANQWTYKNIFEQLVQYGGQGAGQAQFLGTEVTNVLARYTVYGTVFWNRILNLFGGVNTLFFEAAIIATNDQISTSGPAIYPVAASGPNWFYNFQAYDPVFNGNNVRVLKRKRWTLSPPSLTNSATGSTTSGAVSYSKTLKVRFKGKKEYEEGPATVTGAPAPTRYLRGWNYYLICGVGLGVNQNPSTTQNIVDMYVDSYMYFKDP